VTVIELRPDWRGWKVFEAPGLEPKIFRPSDSVAHVNPCGMEAVASSDNAVVFYGSEIFCCKTAPFSETPC
jgi:hypothetical protein